MKSVTPLICVNRDEQDKSHAEDTGGNNDLILELGYESVAV